jgi:hypothetical protein
MNSRRFSYHLLALALRLALIIALGAAGWMVYQKLPDNGPSTASSTSGQTTLQILLRPPADMGKAARDIPVEISPVDIVAVRHEFFVEPRAGQRFEEFLQQRMNGRTLIYARLDRQGRAFVSVPSGNWWLHAVLSGEEDLEWRLPLSISGGKQTVELTPQNAYTRSKSF